MDAPRAATRLHTRAALDWRVVAPPLVNAAAVALCALLLSRLLVVIRDDLRGQFSDFFVFLDAAEQVRAGHSPYAAARLYSPPGGGWVAPIPNLNHPAVAYLLLPFTLLPRVVAAVVWLALSVAAYGAAVALAWRATGGRIPRAYLPAALALVACAPGLLSALAFQQVSTFLALGVVGAWLLRRRGRWVAAGCLLGLLIALKPFLLPLVALPLVRGRWRMLAGVAAGGSAVSLPPLLLGGVALYADWLRTLGAVTWYGSEENVSLVGAAFRRWPQGISALAVTALPFVAAALGAGLVAALRGHADDDRDLALLLALSLLLAPTGWIYYGVLLIPALAYLLAAGPGQRFGARAAAGAALGLLATPYLPLYSWRLYGVAQGYTWGLLLLVPALLLAARREHRYTALMP